MKKFGIALSIIGIMLVGIFGGIFFEQGTFSALICLFGWSPACIFLGVALAGLRLSVSIQPKEQAVIAKPTESAEQIRRRVSKVEQ